MNNQNKMPNRLINEKSPYLLQHAHNPVNWFPWGEEAFAKAAAEDKPVFLSIGYSTCHWCHVMERESFEDEVSAGFLNENFISVKVDREERPDVDSVYMSACQAMTGAGGWPLSIFMDKDKRPFFAGTYFPKYDRAGMPGFGSLLKNVARAWRERRPELEKSALQILKAIEPRRQEPSPIDADIPERAVWALKSSFDSEYGGFSIAPKFPTPHILMFLLRYYHAEKSEKALAMCRKTLDAMRRGGIFDHIGFGFSRYSTDRIWLVPHFEKMLYDNALLCMAYTEFFEITQEGVYADTAKKILTYLTDKMLSPEGGFYSAEDADSEGVEGKFYVFTPEEVRCVLGGDAEEFSRLFDIGQGGNFEGKSIPNLIRGDIPENRREFAEKCRRALYEYRETRVRPHLDDKVLTSQNGLAVAALSLAGKAFGEEEYIEKARATVRFLSEKMMSPDKKLLSRYRDNEARFLGYAEDYAFLIWGLIELYEACFDEEYLELALSLNRSFMDGFLDGETGGFFLSDKNAEQMPVRSKEIYDGAVPSANSVAAINLLRLGRLTRDEELERLSEKTLGAFMKEIARNPAAHAFAAAGILYLSKGGTDIVLTAKDTSSLDGMIGLLKGSYMPFATVRVLAGEGDAKEKAERLGFSAPSQSPAAYVCRGFACMPMAGSEKELEMLLDKGQ